MPKVSSASTKHTTSPYLTDPKRKSGKESSPRSTNATEMTTLQRVIAVGLIKRPPRLTSKLPSQPGNRDSSSKTLRARIQAQTSEAQEAGFALEVMQVKPTEVETKLLLIKKKLTAEKPDLFIIGGGIRAAFEFTEFFERLVNTCREASPGTRIGFNTSPDDIVYTCIRNLGPE